MSHRGVSLKVSSSAYKNFSRTKKEKKQQNNVMVRERKLKALEEDKKSSSGRSQWVRKRKRQCEKVRVMSFNISSSTPKWAWDSFFGMPFMHDIFQGRSIERSKLGFEIRKLEVPLRLILNLSKWSKFRYEFFYGIDLPQASNWRVRLSFT